MSKGDKQRPTMVTYGKYIDNWEKAFGKDNVDRVLREVAENASESVYIPKGKDIKEIVKDIEEKSSVTLLNDNTLEAQLEKIKMES